ncbi:dCTP deaminase, partial [Francisella tularensis subsp. holarctica]|nr:dCTP deaminase [Francisella tularensis subsp. holarctica]
MTLKSDKWIKKMSQEHNMIENFEAGQEKVINNLKIVSYGTSSSGYD